YYLFARAAFAGRWTAILTGLLCAAHPYWVINTAELGDGVLSTFLLAACVLLGAVGGRSGGVFPSWLYGVGLAGSGLAPTVQGPAGRHAAPTPRGGRRVLPGRGLGRPGRLADGGRTPERTRVAAARLPGDPLRDRAGRVGFGFARLAFEPPLAAPGQAPGAGR